MRETDRQKDRIVLVGDLTEGQVKKMWREVADKCQKGEHADLAGLVI